MMTKARSSQRRSKTLPMLAVLLLVIVVALIAYFGLHKHTTPPSANQYTKGNQGPSQGIQTKSPATSNSTGSAKSNGASNGPLLAPSGDFVSNHHPNLGGSPAPNSIASVCNTTPGATCQIFFTKDGVQKSLPAQVTDSGGSTYWNWTLQSIGLTAGSWQVKAVTTLGSQTQNASDAMELVIAP